MTITVGYRGYKIILFGGGTKARHYIYKDEKEVHSMTSTEEQVYEWIDKDIRSKVLEHAKAN